MAIAIVVTKSLDLEQRFELECQKLQRLSHHEGVFVKVHASAAMQHMHTQCHCHAQQAARTECGGGLEEGGDVLRLHLARLAARLGLPFCRLQAEQAVHTSSLSGRMTD